MAMSEDEVVGEDDDVTFSLFHLKQQVGVPEIDLQTIDNLGRTLIDVARYFYLDFDDILFYPHTNS